MISRPYGNVVKEICDEIILRGRGLVWGLDFSNTSFDATTIATECYKNGLIIETAGRNRLLKNYY